MNQEFKESCMYGCLTENNTCERKNDCERTLFNIGTTLWKQCCNQNNNYVLFINKELNETKNEDLNEEKGE